MVKIYDPTFASFFNENGAEKDAVRNEFLTSMELTVLHFSNLDIRQHFDSVCQEISEHLRYTDL